MVLLVGPVKIGGITLLTGLGSTNQIDGLLAFGHGHFPCSEHTFFSCNGQSASSIGCGLVDDNYLGLFRHCNGAALLGQVQRGAALQFGGLQVLFLADALLFDGLVGTDACGLSRLLGCNLRAL